MSERKGRPRGASIAPTDNDWRVLRYLLQLILPDVRERGGWHRILYYETVSCSCTQAAIADEVGMSEAAVRKAVRRLRAREVLYVERRGSRATRYHLYAGAAHALIDTLSLFAPLPAPWPTHKATD